MTGQPYNGRTMGRTTGIPCHIQQIVIGSVPLSQQFTSNQNAAVAPTATCVDGYVVFDQSVSNHPDVSETKVRFLPQQKNHEKSEQNRLDLSYDAGGDRPTQNILGIRL